MTVDGMRTVLARHGEDDVVAVAAEGHVTAADFHRRVAAVAAALAAGGRGPLLVGTDDRLELACVIVGAWAAGRQVLLPPNDREQTLADIERAAAPCQRVAGLRDINVQPAAPGPFGPVCLPPEQRVAAVYTSGSTGEFSVHWKTAAQLLGEAETLAEMLGVRPGDRVLATVPPHHIYGLLFSVLVPLVAGAAFVVETPFHRSNVAAAVDEHAPRVVATVPFHLRELARLPDGSLGRAGTVVSSTAPLDPALAKDLVTRFGLDLVEVFGSTETGGIASRRPAEDEAWSPLPGVTVASDPDGRMLVTSPFAEPPLPFKGGDVVELVDGGRFRHLGRMDGVVKVGGKRISVAALERSLLRIEAVRDAAVLAVPVEGERGTRLLAAVVTDRPTTPQALRDELARSWDAAVLPRVIRVVDAIPREDNGKVQRRTLADCFALAPESLDRGMGG